MTAPLAVGDLVRAKRELEAHGPLMLIGRTFTVSSIHPPERDGDEWLVGLTGFAIGVSSYWLERVAEVESRV